MVKKEAKQFATIRKLTDMSAPDLKIKHYPTGIYSLDKVLQGGIPAGRITEIIGQESSFKSTIAMHVAKGVLDSGGKVLYFDLENSLSEYYFESIGIDPYDPGVEFYTGEPAPAEAIFDQILYEVEQEKFDLIIVDSLAVLASKAEIDGEISDANVAQIPRILSKFGRKIQYEIGPSKTAMLFINQWRANMQGGTYAPTKIPTGGWAMKYYASLRLETSRIAKITNSKKEVIGSEMEVTLLKSKVSQPFRKPQYKHYLDIGIDVVGNVLDAATDAGVVRQSGAWYYIEGESFQGYERARDFLTKNPAILEGLKVKMDKPAPETLTEETEKDNASS